MNPWFFKSIALIFTFKREFYYVLITFLCISLLPFIAVILLTHTGIDIVSDKLAKFDKNTKTIQLYYPTGQPYKTIHTDVTWPTTGLITLEFGQSDLPYQIMHSGIDIANPNGQIGDTITPMMQGKVIYAGEIFWGFGKHIIIDHGDNITSIYGHLDKIYTVQGKEVKPGDIIGREGTTGWSTGPHLHFQVDVWGIPVNPRTFLGDRNP